MCGLPVPCMPAGSVHDDDDVDDDDDDDDDDDLPPSSALGEFSSICICVHCSFLSSGCQSGHK